MKDAEIGKALALAIGYLPEHVDVLDLVLSKEVVYVFRPFDPSHLIGDPKKMAAGLWHRFDYLDWRTIALIAQRYDLFPRKQAAGMWPSVEVRNPIDYWTVRHYPGVFKTPQQAIAMAVIRLEKEKATAV